jgi:uncharacterized protein YidB (DUF937 family)
MNILGTILGSVLGGGQQQQQQNPLLNIALSMLSNGGQQGGLQGLIGQFTQAGLGNVVNSWIGTGQNMPVSADQLQQVLGSGQLGQIAQQLGLSQGEASTQLAGLLPDLIDKLTPHGQAPQAGLGNSDAIMGMLGKLMQQR